MFKVGITGQSGFIGTHLFNFLGLKKDIIKVKFKDEYFDNKKCLENFVKKCDIIVHLAAMNRHNEPQVIYNTNIILVNKKHIGWPILLIIKPTLTTVSLILMLCENYFSK